MQKEQITDKEGICLLTLYMMGSTLILGVASDAKNDAWLSVIAAIFMVLPMIFIYSRILFLYPGMDLYDILNIIFGKTLGKIIAFIYIWYSFHLGALVVRNFAEFLNTVAIPETPMIVSMLYLILVSIAAVRSGIEVMSRISAYFLPILLIILFIIQILIIPQLRFNYIKPFLEKGLGPVLRGGFQAFSFPFAESIIFTGVFYTLKNRKSPYKVYLWGTLLPGSIIIILTLRNILILGPLLESLYFPSYVAVSRISIGDFIQRIEVNVAIVFVCAAYIKCTVCLFVACRGLAKVFNLKDYRSVVIQLGLLMVYFSYTIYDNIMEMRYWAHKVYAYYAFPFQVVVPIIILIGAEIKARKSN